MDKKMTEQPILSIVTICFNNKNDIERTCQSITSQTWRDFEWIVVDGGSTDGTLEILEKYKEHIDVLISEPDTGRYNAMNKGILKSAGEWINFMNGGDTFHDSNTLKEISYLFNDKNADILYGNMNFITNTNEPSIIRYAQNISPDYFYGNGISHQSSFIRRSLFVLYGLYNENYAIVSDWEKWIIFSLLGCKFKYIDYVISDFYDGGEGSIPSPEHIKERNEVQKRYQIRSNIKITTKYYLFGFIPILILKKGEKMKLKLFFVIPVYETKELPNKKVWKFLGIPLLKKKTKNNKTKIIYKFLGIPVLTIKRKNRYE